MQNLLLRTRFLYKKSLYLYTFKTSLIGKISNSKIIQKGTKYFYTKSDFDKIYFEYKDNKNNNIYKFGFIEELDTTFVVTDIIKNINVCVSESLKSKSNFSIEVENHKTYKHDKNRIINNINFIKLKQKLDDLGITININKHENKYVFFKYRVQYIFDDKILNIYI